MADVDGDGSLNVIAVDSNANVVCFDAEGIEVWENRLSGFPTVGATVGDVNNDGVLDVVVGTNAGHLWAMDGKTGAYLENFPIKVGGDRDLVYFSLMS